MFPIKYVIFWNQKPCGIDTHGRLFKIESCDSPNKVAYFDTIQDIATYMRKSGFEHPYEIKKIEFRILN